MAGRGREVNIVGYRNTRSGIQAGVTRRGNQPEHRLRQVIPVATNDNTPSLRGGGTGPGVRRVVPGGAAGVDPTGSYPPLFANSDMRCRERRWWAQRAWIGGC